MIGPDRAAGKTGGPPPAPATLASLVSWAADRLASAGLVFGHGTDNPRDEAAWLVLAATGHPPDDPAVDARTRVGARGVAAAAELVRRRIDERRPAAYLTGRAWFAGMPFAVDERVAVPRSPLAAPIRQRLAPWLGSRPVDRILELGTGCGCIAAACARAFPEAAVDATDVDEGALELAAMNLSDLGLSRRVRLHRADVFAGLPPARYDLIVANPPYVDTDAMARLPAEYRWEPPAALAAGDDGLAVIARIVDDAAGWLGPAGILVVETGGAGAALERRYPRLPVTWLELRDGGDGVCLAEAEALARAGRVEGG